MTAEPAAAAAANQATSDLAPLVPTVWAADHVSAREITELLHHLAGLRGARSDDPAERVAFLAHKTALLTRIGHQHTRPPADPLSSTTPTAPEGRTP